METFTNHIGSYRWNRRSFCSKMLKGFPLMFVMVGLAQAEVTKLACSDDKGVQPISERLDKQGGEYVLIEDCVGIPNGISIVASDVQLNLGGHTLSGPGCDGNSVGIDVVGGSNVHVTGGTVKNFEGGVKVRANGGSADHNQLSRLKVTENCSGIELRSSNNNHVNFNDVSGNFRDGVEVDNSDNNQVEFNVINENGARVGRGIIVSDSDSNVLAFNTISRNVNGGVTLTSGTTRDTVGPGSNNNTIAGNVVIGTKAFPGITVQVGKNNTIHGNLLSSNRPGIELQPDAIGNFVLRNTALDNALFDLSDLNCNNNEWRDNIFNPKMVNPPAGCIQ